ncbi:hypothetical protein VRRI112168_02775 [Vreelandella rituensis]|uniref:Uncharacterized protein n=1 Tax=Vreelandella rituensis TaxID=2282306 RepID=A0A368UAW0_9GAMM|nr:hypothetical protein [Halomonas rituensis]RCV93667.1 hypothetical protein DU506_00490 [Halomonas rituensis]
MKTIQYTTPKGGFVVVLETGRTQSAPGEFFSMLEGRKPAQVSLPDRYLIQDAPGDGFVHTYATPGVNTLEEAIAYAENQEAQSETLAAIASTIAK